MPGLRPFAALSILFIMQAPACAADRDWAPLLKELGAADFAERETAQRELEKIPADEMETLLDLADRQVDPEVRSRLQLRISGMALERLTGQANAKPTTRAHITGRIVDDDGKGVPNLPMKATTWSMGQEFARGMVLDDFFRGFRSEARSDSQGRFDLPVPFPDILYSVSAAPDGAGPRKMMLPESGPAGNLKLSTTGFKMQRFAGLVIDAQGRPEPNQMVEIRGQDQVIGWFITEKDGTFDGTSPNWGDGAWQAIVRVDDMATPIRGAVLNNNPVTVSLSPAATLEGFVREGAEGGKGIPNARVVLGLRGPGASMATLQKARTDARGHFQLTGIPAIALARTQYDLYAEAPGYVNRNMAPLAGRFRPGAAENIDLIMDRAAVVTGRILDHQGHALPGALVGIDSRMLAGYLDEWRFVETDAQGRYTLAAGNPGGKVIIAAYSSKEGAARIELDPLTPGPLLRKDLQLPGAVRPRGVVTDQQGKPIKGVTCRIGELRGGIAGEYATTTGPDGLFDLGQTTLMPGESLSFSAPRFFRKNATTYGIQGEGAAMIDLTTQPSDFNSRANAPQFYLNQEIPLNAAPGQTVDLKVKLEPAQMLEFTGILLDAHGNPVPGADVLLLTGDATPDGWLTNLTLIDRQGKRLTAGPPNIVSGASQTGPDGRWTILAIRENGIGTPPRPQKVDGSRFSIGAYTGGREALIRAMRGDYSGINDTLQQNVEIPKDSSRIDLTLRLK